MGRLALLPERGHLTRLAHVLDRSVFELFSFDVLPRLRPESEDLQGDALAVELIIFDLLGIQTTRLVHVLIVFRVTSTSLSTHDAELGVEDRKSVV